PCPCQESSRSGKSSIAVLRPPSSSSSSSKVGSLTTYFSADHAPKSSKRHRSLQNGNSLFFSESTGVLQIGQLRTILNHSGNHAVPSLAAHSAYPKTRSGAPVAMRVKVW